MRIVAAIVAGILGLSIGSYLNVVIYRLPRRLSTAWPGSRCPTCGTPIRPRDNLPLLSYLLLRGRCRACGAAIHWSYPVVEGLTSLLFAACVLRFGVGVAAAAGALFSALMIVLAAIDIEHLLLPDRLTFPGIAAGLLLSSWLPWSGLRNAFLGAALGALILLSIWGAWYLVRHEEGMGLGDVKMLGLIGAFLGVEGMLVALFLAAVSGAVVGLALLRRSGPGLKAKLPFGAFLAVGGLVALFVGQDLARWYLGLL
jgi:leader peptidase (prepilin peptidase)/N-methyltransferase